MNNEITNISLSSASISWTPPAHRSDRAPMSTIHDPAADTVEFSPTALSMMHETVPSSFRRARVEAVRQQIAAGTFETPERIRGTVERLVNLLT